MKFLDSRFDYNRTRFCVRCNSGIACYRGANNERGEWKGDLVGIAQTENDAQRFLDGAFVKLKTA